MAYTRISAHEVLRVCEKYEKMIDVLAKQRMQTHKDKLMKRFLFPLSDEKANVKAFWKERDNVFNQVRMEQGFDYQTYESLRESCKITRAGDFITIDSVEAEFINRLRK